MPLEAGAADEEIGFQAARAYWRCTRWPGRWRRRGRSRAASADRGRADSPRRKRLRARSAAVTCGTPASSRTAVKGYRADLRADRFHAVSVAERLKRGGTEKGSYGMLTRDRAAPMVIVLPESHYDVNTGPHKRRGPSEITSCGGGSSRACGVFSALASADLYPTFSYPRLTPYSTTGTCQAGIDAIPGNLNSSGLGTQTQ